MLLLLERLVRSCAADASTSGEGWDLRQMPHPLHLHHEQCRPDCSESHQGSHFRIEASFLWDEEQAISAGIAIFLMLAVKTRVWKVLAGITQPS